MALSKLTILNEQYVLRKMLGDRGQYDATYLAWNLKKEHDAVIVREFNPTHLVSRVAGGARLVPKNESAKKLFEYGLNCFIREAAAAVLIDHPNIVNQQAYFQENGTAYCVSTYHQGATLSMVLDAQSGKLQERAAFTIMMPLLDGLQAGHRKGLIHGRLSPQRIYLTKSGRPMLLRFHVTQILLARRCGRVDDMMVPGYTPPELLMPDGKKGPWSDVYACGATLYSIITGKVPPYAEKRIKEDPFPDILYQDKNISAGVKKVLYRAMTMECTERPQSITELKQELLNAIALESQPYVSLDSMASYQIPVPEKRKGNLPEFGITDRGADDREPELITKRKPKAPTMPLAMLSEEKKQLLQSKENEAHPLYRDEEHHGDGMVATAEPVIDTNPLGPFGDEEKALSPLVETIPHFKADEPPHPLFVSPLQQVVNSATANRTRKLGIAALGACLVFFAIAGTLRMGSGGGGDIVPPTVEAAPILPSAPSSVSYLALLAQGDSIQNLAGMHLTNGDTLLQTMAYAEAANLYQQMLLDWPGDSAVVSRLDMLEALRENAGKPVAQNEATNPLSEPTLPVQPSRTLDLAEFYVEQGDSLYAVGQWEVARRKYQVAQEYLPDDPRITSMLARIEERQSQALVDAQVERYLTRAQSMINVENYSEARRAYELVLDLRPDDPVILAGIARVDSFLVNSESLEKQYLYLKGQGDGLFAQQSFAAALVSYEAAQSLRPEDAFLAERIAAIKDSLGRAEEQAALGDRQYTLYRKKGDSLMAAMDIDGAIAAYQMALLQKSGDTYVLDRIEKAKEEQVNSESVLWDQDGIFIMPEVQANLLNESEIINDVKYPSEARNRRVEGLVVVRLTVGEDGRVSNAFVAKGIGYGCDQEALRVIYNARFEPATHKGKAVPSWYNHPIVFKLVR